MRVSLVVVAILGIVSSSVLFVPSAKAGAFDDVKFTSVVTDIQDAAPGYVDLKDLSFGEPGDDTVVFRYQPQDFTDPGVLGEVDFWFDAPAGSFRSFTQSDGSHSDDIASCTVEGAYEYCVYTYETLGAIIGDTIAAPYMTSYLTGIVDYAPGAGGAPQILIGAPGSDYVITGCTKEKGCGGVQTSGGLEKLGMTAKKTSATGAPGADVTYELTIVNQGVDTNFTLSSVGLQTGYSAAFSPLSSTLAKNDTATSTMKVSIPADAKSGTKVTFKAKALSAHGANKTVDLTLDVKTASSGVKPTSGGPTSNGGPVTSDDFTPDNGGSSGDNTSKKSPGIEFAINILAVGVLVVALRRKVE